MTKAMKTRERGYSLAEVMVATAIFAIIILAALLIYDRSNRMFKRGVESSNMQQNTRVAFEKLTADLRMTGFDFDRDGVPTGSSGGVNVYQQTDEQFEYIGPAAVTIRSNFDYETETTPCSPSVTENCDNGREGTPNYESARFPVVTTGNDEIVTYGLVPDSQTTIPACNTSTNCVQFYADMARPRAAYPGGTNETAVQIPGVDLCNGGCNNPPYTLYRFTLNRDESSFTNGANVVRTPLASNIRSMQLTYYQDGQGTDPLKDLTNTTDVSTGASIGGAGQWLATNPGALVPQREIRSKVNSVRLTLIGMNEQPDRSFTDTSETIAAVKNFRKYRLETLIAPRNIQKRGMREQDTFPPAAPTGVGYCKNYCGGLYVTWTAPQVTNVYGAPDQYKILYGEQIAGGGFPCEAQSTSATWAYVFGSTQCGPMDPSKTYKMEVVALNSYGSASSAAVLDITPLNSTQMSPPTWPTAPIVAATDNQNGKVTLTWNRPTTNASGAYNTCFAQPPASSPTPQTNVPAGEIYGYQVERSTTGTGGWVTVGDPSVVNSKSDVVTWADTSAVNCTTYYYRVTAVERCASNATYNVGGNTALGSSGPTSTNAQGLATSGVAPKAPDNLTIDQAATNATCNPGAQQCTPVMNWPKVTQDTNNEHINIVKYKIYKHDYPSGAWSLYDTLVLPAPPAGPLVNYTGPATSNVGVYEFRVTAVQCTEPNGEGSPSVARKWPCDVDPGALTPATLQPMQAPGAFDGNGSQATPWLFDGDATVTVPVVDITKVSMVTFRVYSMPDGQLVQQYPDNASPFSFTWTVDPSSTQVVTADVVDTSNCARQVIGYVTDEPQGCCLEPYSLDPTSVVFSAGTNYVDVYLRNICSSSLTLNNVTVAWNSDITGSAGKLQAVSFPLTAGGYGTNSLGGSITSPQTVAAVFGTKAILGTDNNYRIRLTFGKNLAQNPLTGFSATYTNIQGQASCTILP